MHQTSWLSAKLLVLIWMLSVQLTINHCHFLMKLNSSEICSSQITNGWTKDCSIKIFSKICSLNQEFYFSDPNIWMKLLQKCLWKMFLKNFFFKWIVVLNCIYPNIYSIVPICVRNKFLKKEIESLSLT